MQKGFSLVELMIAVSVTLLLITVAIPSFETSVLGVRGSSLADKLISSIHMVRSEAISRNSRVTLCASVDGESCDDTAVNWSRGWIATWYNPELAKTEVIRYWKVSSQGARVQLGGVNSHQLIYKANGEAFLSADGSAELVPPIAIGFRTQIDGCVDFEYKHARTIQITPFGTVTVEKEKCI
ncbi:MAG: hypothetical protein OFPI_11050 [Osedax symbiont Rs2]|nr:MAG: hypothetical protein OFPII_38270 [Osedax symbiont Rs1]EPJ53365.1 MAG: hypothetical protein OFPI_11050 [Osedax symbiont Rs2]